MAKNLVEYSLMVLVFAALSGCGSMGSLEKYNPFGSGSGERSNTPANATEYICDGKNRFFVRMLNNGNDAWLIYPDHEVNLPKTGGDNRYSSGAITLVINGAETTLNDGEKIAYTNCKPQETKK